ncbi:major facilitator superfamily domain-containing protein [Parasitella parasitica]|nr:major facilitator superfamily domain-containing protein [Parasitella parasitica]
MEVIKDKEELASYCSGETKISLDLKDLETTKQKEYDFVSLENNGSCFVEHCNQQDEKKLIRKLDLRIMPLFCLFYFSDFLDRANIGNATLAGLRTDLGMTSNELSTAISAFFITFIIFEIPSNVVLKNTNAAMWLSLTMLIWGITTLAIAFVKNFAGLLIARLILGAAQSGYSPGLMFLLSKAYTPQEFSMRVSILITMATLSGILSGPLAYAMTFLDGRHGLHDWQYLFIFEGTPTIALSIVSYFVLFDDIQKVKWLSTKQKELQLNRMIPHQSACAGHDSISLKTFKIVLFDWKTWAFSVVYLLNHINLTSITVFAPTLIDGFGFDHKTAQLLTAPPCVIGTIGILVGGYLAGRYNCRSPLLAIGSLIIAIGYTCLLLLKDKWALYSTLFFIPSGMGMQAAAAVGWSAINYHDLNVRAVAVALVFMVGNVGSIIAAYLFRAQDAPRYAFGMLFNLGTALVSGILSILTGYFLYRENCRRDKNPNEKNQFRFFL